MRITALILILLLIAIKWLGTDAVEMTWFPDGVLSKSEQIYDGFPN